MGKAFGMFIEYFSGLLEKENVNPKLVEKIVQVINELINKYE